jgi:hypothetical protein
MRSLLLTITVLLAVMPASAQQIEFYTIDAGGEIAASGDDWELSGTFGQWDATPNNASAAGPWEVTGGFWGLGTESDFLFKDSFES